MVISCPPKGLTLIELLVCLSMLSLLCVIALPNFTELLSRKQTDALTDKLVRQLAHARALSIITRRDVEACGSSDGKQCDEQWSKGWVIYSPGTSSIVSMERIAPGAVLNWTGFTSRIRFHPNGTSPLGNGYFLICNSKGQVHSQLIINRQGRIRQTTAPTLSTQPPMSCH